MVGLEGQGSYQHSDIDETISNQFARDEETMNGSFEYFAYVRIERSDRRIIMSYMSKVLQSKMACLTHVIG